MTIVVLDASCFINLYATGNVRRLLRDLGWSWYLPRAVRVEAFYTRARDEHGDIVRAPIDTRTLLQDGLIRDVDAGDTEEVSRYVQLAADLDDGEAMALAIANHRGWKLATDDRKARRLARDLAVEVVTTPEVMREWTNTAKLTPIEVVQILRNVEFGARFVPAEHMPEFKWWMDSLNLP